MSQTVYEFNDYRLFLRSLISQGSRAKRGKLSELAQSIPCQVSYVSRVMAGQTNFSLEQADSVARHIGLTEDESYYFILLVELARAGTPSLRSQFQKRINQQKEKRLNLKERVGVQYSLNREDQARYYSHWYYAAVHVMSGIPSLRTKEAMARHLGLPLSKISEMLEFLSSVGLVEFLPDGSFRTGVGRIHLEKNSPMMIRHHMNWRFQAIRDMERDLENGIHYSVLVNVSREDIERLHTMVAQFIESFMQVVHPSEDETSCCLGIDLFSPHH